LPDHIDILLILGVTAGHTVTPLTLGAQVISSRTSHYPFELLVFHITHRNVWIADKSLFPARPASLCPSWTQNLIFILINYTSWNPNFWASI
jgi:hypothetical protein